MVIPSWPQLTPDREASWSSHSHVAPGLPIRSAAWKTFCNREPEAQTETDWEMGLFSPLWFILVFILLPETWQTPSPVSQLPSAGIRAPCWATAFSRMETGMCLAERLFLPFHLAHYFSTSQLFIPSTFLASLLFPCTCTTNADILPHLHVSLSADVMKLQSKCSATTKHQEEM